MEAKPLAALRPPTETPAQVLFNVASSSEEEGEQAWGKWKPDSIPPRAGQAPVTPPKKGAAPTTPPKAPTTPPKVPPKARPISAPPFRGLRLRGLGFRV